VRDEDDGSCPDVPDLIIETRAYALQYGLPRLDAGSVVDNSPFGLDLNESLAGEFAIVAIDQALVHLDGNPRATAQQLHGLNSSGKRTRHDSDRTHVRKRAGQLIRLDPTDFIQGWIELAAKLCRRIQKGAAVSYK